MAGDRHRERGFASLVGGKPLKGRKSGTNHPAAIPVEAQGTLQVTGERAHRLGVGADGEAACSDFDLKGKVLTIPRSSWG